MEKSKLVKMAVSALVLASAISTAPVSGEQVLLAAASCASPSSYTTYSYDQYPNSYSSDDQGAYQRPRRMYSRGQANYQDDQNYSSGQPAQSYWSNSDQGSSQNNNQRGFAREQRMSNNNQNQNWASDNQASQANQNPGSSDWSSNSNQNANSSQANQGSWTSNSNQNRSNGSLESRGSWESTQR